MKKIFCRQFNLRQKNIAAFAKENPYLCHSLYHSEPQKKEKVLQKFSYNIPQEIENHIKEHGLIQNTPTGEKALFACSVLKVLEVKNNKSLVEIGIYTGRKHQIRVQLAHAGFPLVGDTKYAPKKLLAPNDKFFLQCHSENLSGSSSHRVRSAEWNFRVMFQALSISYQLRS